MTDRRTDRISALYIYRLQINLMEGFMVNLKTFLTLAMQLTILLEYTKLKTKFNYYDKIEEFVNKAAKQNYHFGDNRYPKTHPGVIRDNTVIMVTISTGLCLLLITWLHNVNV